MATRTLIFIDLFADAGVLSEGFIRAGFTPLAHIETDKYHVKFLEHYLSKAEFLEWHRDCVFEKSGKSNNFVNNKLIEYAF
ncbi:MAG: hypothetical protein LBN27_11500 [Prevotellaceae bacterium]|jgi:DNA (cytosine-5)-methyltransferase 1|nr:hypothetical protein [Prevotellaceae bacterium]